jgi:chromatin segregation and condensation protein Rec8/ScpA/Scc1 (kleisin family)
VASTLMAGLELSREGALRLEQEEAFSLIHMQADVAEDH